MTSRKNVGQRQISVKLFFIATKNSLCVQKERGVWMQCIVEGQVMMSTSTRKEEKQIHKCTTGSYSFCPRSWWILCHVLFLFFFLPLKYFQQAILHNLDGHLYGSSHFGVRLLRELLPLSLCLWESWRKRSGVPPGPAAPTLPSHLLAATALSGNYCRGDKYGDKLVFACKMYEVSEHGKRCTWPGNEWCEGASAAHHLSFSSSPCHTGTKRLRSWYDGVLYRQDTCIFRWSYDFLWP